MKSLQGRTITLVFTLGSAIFAGSALGQDPNAYVYLAHAAAGRNVSSTTNPAFPVDMRVNGHCVGNGISYGQIQGPISAPAGTFNFRFTKANSTFPCTGDEVFSAKMRLHAGTTYFGTLSVDSSHNFKAMFFTADTSPVPPGQTRVEVVNTTQETLRASLTMTNGQTASLDILPGTLQINTVISGSYPTFIGEANGTVFSGPIVTSFAQRNAYLYVLAGSPADQAVDFIGPKAILGVF